jgi:hypothetical protein
MLMLRRARGELIKTAVPKPMLWMYMFLNLLTPSEEAASGTKRRRNLLVPGYTSRDKSISMPRPQKNPPRNV